MKLSPLFLRPIFGIFLLIPSIDVIAEDAFEAHWFKNETTCMDAKITVRSFCEGNASSPMNNSCTEQILVIDSPGKKIITRNLLEKVNMDNFRLATSVRCVMANSKPYLYFLIDNGGSCDTCESSAIVDLQGKWRRYSGRWYAPRQEKKLIEKFEGSWSSVAPYYIKNTIIETRK